MKKSILFFALVVSNLLYAQTTLSTYPTLAANNGSSAVTFELVTSVAIEITSLECVFSVANAKEIYYRPGGVLHGPATPGIPGNGWILHETVTNVTTNGTLIPSNIPLTNSLILQPGTYGFCVNSPGGSLRYRTWVTTDPSAFTNGTVTLNVGVGFGFGGTLTGWIASRAFVGSVTYSLLPQGPNDAGVSELVAPDGGCAGTYDVRAEIRNFGVNQIMPVQVEWSVNGVLQTPYTHSTLLDTLNGTGPNSAVVTLGSVTLSGGIDTIKIWTNLPNNVQDTSNANDTLIEIFNSLPVISTFPYYEDFENGSGGEWFPMGTNSTWTLGTPAKVNIIGAASGDSAWVNGGLTGNYLANDQSSMNSPCFDLSGFEGTAWVALDVNWYTEGSWDGAVLQSSVDAGKTWQRVGQAGDPYNWYNSTSLTANPGGQPQGWAGTGTTSSNGWKRAKHLLDASAVVENLRFRIAFGSDGSVQYEGFAFDNFTIVDYKAANLGPNILSLCGNSFTELDPNVNFNGYISWSTGDSINEKINASTTGTYWVMYTDSMIDVTSYDTIEMIQSVAPQIQFESLVDTILLTGSTTLDPKTSASLTYDWQPVGVNYPFLLVKGADYGVGTHAFSLTVTDSLLCKDQEQVNVVVIDITGIEENENASINFYPNPVQDELNVELNGFDNSPVIMQILDIQGKMHMNYTFDHVQGQTHKLNLNSLMKGAYVLRVQSESKHVVVRLIVN